MLIFAAAALLLAGAGFLPGRVLVPMDLLSDTGAWKANPGVRKPVSNHLLSDAVLQFVPWDAHARRSIAAGRIPWTNPYAANGAPFWANPVPALLSPFTWPRLASGTRGWAPSVFLKLVAAGGGAYWLAREMGAEALPATISGIVFLLSGFSVVWALHPQTSVFAFLPWLAGAMLRLTRRITVRDSAVAIIFAALATAGGHPETLAFGVIAIFAFVLWESAAARREGSVARLGWAAGAAATGFLLLAIQWVPFVEVLGQARASDLRRAQAVESFRRFAIPGSVLPGFLGSPLAGELDLTGAVAGSENFNVRSQAFVGFVALVLIVVAGGRLPRAFRRGLTVGAAALLVAWRVPLIRSSVHALPLLGLAAPEYASAVFVLFAAAACGPALVLAADRPPPRRIAFALLLAGGALAAAGIAGSLPALRPVVERFARAGIERLRAGGHLRLPPAIYEQRIAGYLVAARWTALRRLLLPGFFWALAGIGLLRRAHRIPVLAVALAGEMLAFGVGYLPAVRETDVPGDPPAITALRQRDPGGEFLMIATADDYPADLATFARVRDLRSYDVLASRALVRALGACGYDEKSAAFPAELSAPQRACLAAAGVRWVVSRRPAGERRVGGDDFPGVGLYELAGARRPPPLRDGPPPGFREGAAISAVAVVAAVLLSFGAARGSTRGMLPPSQHPT